MLYSFGFLITVSDPSIQLKFNQLAKIASPRILSALSLANSKSCSCFPTHSFSFSWVTVLTSFYLWYTWMQWLCPYLWWPIFIINMIRIRKYPGHYWGTPLGAFMESSNWERKAYPSVGGSSLKGGWMKGGEPSCIPEFISCSFLFPNLFWYEHKAFYPSPPRWTMPSQTVSQKTCVLS